MGFLLHRATRADHLVAGLGAMLSTPLDDVFATEIVAVPTRGVERWLAQSLSGVLGTTSTTGPSDAADGVCAGIDFPSPERLVGDAVADLTGIDPRTDPWHPRQAVWALLSVIDAAEGQEWARPLWQYLGADKAGGLGRRYATAFHLAGLFDSYAADRPQMIGHWLAGRDTDGLDQPLPPAMSWQAELLRRLRTEIDIPGPAELLHSAVEALTAGQGATGLPDRLSVFGPTRLSYATLTVLAALSHHRDVHLWLPHPSPTLWDEVSTALREADPDLIRANDHTADVPQNRLLSYLGRDSRELQLRLSRLDTTMVDQLLAPADHDQQVDPTAETGLPLLARLQADLAADRRLSTDQQPVITAEDDSIAIHSAHGPDRQVEVLRELVLGLLADDPTLEPRDIIVMCPDIETFAPLVSAAFGAQTSDPDETPDSHPAHQLRVRLADRSLRQLNPLLQVLATLFELAESRIEASAVVDLCSTDPVATKFDLREEDLLRLRELVARSGVRWGLDAIDRQRFAMGDFAQNTWAAGLDRMLLGVAMDEDGEHYIGTSLPMDDVDAGDVELVGRLAEVIDRLRTVITSFDRSQSLRAWIAACRQALDLLTAVTPTDNWQLGQAYGELTRIADSAADRDDVQLTRREARAVLADLFAGRPSRANFRTGTLTVATLLPMRSVPHRVVCLLGLDDGVFPRGGHLDGDDLLAREPWIGDRDRRSEDRQLLLDAIMSATEHLVIIYSGADPRTNATKPPSVPLGELLDVLDQTATAADGGPAREQITHRHPLQPFDPANFRATDQHPPISFDASALTAARASVQPRSTPTPVYSDAELPGFELPALLPVDELVRFFKHPVKRFLQTRAGIGLYEDDDPVSDEIPVDPDGLQTWAIGDRMLRSHLAGQDVNHLAIGERLRGDVPPKQFGGRFLSPIAANVAEVARRARTELTGRRRNVDLAAELIITPPEQDPSAAEQQVTVVGTVPGVYDDRLVTVSYSKLGPNQRLEAWIRLLAICVTEPGDWQAVTIGRGDKWTPGTSRLGPVPPDFARDALTDLVMVYRIGMQAPLPLLPTAAAEYATLLNAGKRSAELLRARVSNRVSYELGHDTVYRMVFGDDFGFDQLIKTKARPGDVREGLASPSRFGALARRVWHPLLVSEELR